MSDAVGNDTKRDERDTDLEVLMAAWAPMADWRTGEVERMQSRVVAGDVPVAVYTIPGDSASPLVAVVQEIYLMPGEIATRWLTHVRTDASAGNPLVREELLQHAVHDTLAEALTWVYAWGCTNYTRGETDPKSAVDRSMNYFDDFDSLYR